MNDPDDAEESVNNVTVGIMKQSTEQAADKADPSLPGRAEESKPEVKSGPTEPETSVSALPGLPINLVLPRSICWSKTIEVIYFEQPQATYSLHEYFTSRPRPEPVRNNEPVVSNKEEIPDEDSQEDQG